MSIAIFGGSFDPPHSGHIAVVKEALKELNIEKLYVVPAFQNPLKDDIYASGELRLNWLKKIFEGEKRVEVSDFEIKQDRVVYTVESVQYFRQLDPHIYLIIGADNLDELHKWHNFHALDSLVTWVVATRDGYEQSAMTRELNIYHDVSSTQIRAQEREHMLDDRVRLEIVEFYKNIKEKDCKSV